SSTGCPSNRVRLKPRHGPLTVRWGHRDGHRAGALSGRRKKRATTQTCSRPTVHTQALFTYSHTSLTRSRTAASNGRPGDRPVKLQGPQMGLVSQALSASNHMEAHMAVTTENPAGTTTIRPFTVPVTPEMELEALRARIASTRWPDPELVADFSQGVQQSV